MKERELMIHLVRPTTKEKITQYDVNIHKTTCFKKSKINTNVFINKFICRFKHINRFESFRHLSIIFFSF